MKRLTLRTNYALMVFAGLCLAAMLHGLYWHREYTSQRARSERIRAEADSVKRFFVNYVYRFRRPMEVWIEADSASPFQFPLNLTVEDGVWKVPVVWGRLFYFDYNHLGIDFFGYEGDTVRAIYDGTILTYGPAPGYGDLVVVIEHEYREAWNRTTVPRRFLSIYGHLRPVRVRGAASVLPWGPGARVKRGDVIGFINDDDHNGDGSEHLHLGIRLESGDRDQANHKWLRGYDNEAGDHLRFYRDPLVLFGRPVRFRFDD